MLAHHAPSFLTRVTWVSWGEGKGLFLAELMQKEFGAGTLGGKILQDPCFVLLGASGSWEGGQNPGVKVPYCTHSTQFTVWQVGEQILLQQKWEGEG